MDGIMLSHETYNRIMQVVDSYNGIIPSFDFFGSSHSIDMSELDLVFMHNNTGADIQKGTPVKFLEPPNSLYTDWATDFSVIGEEATENNEIAGVTIETIPDQCVGLVKVNGLCIVSGVTIDATTDTHVTIDSGGNLTTAAGGPLVILGTLTAINTFYGGSNCDIVCNLSSSGSGGVALGTFNANMDASDPTGDINFDPADNPEGYGGLNGDKDCKNDLGLAANTSDKALVYTSANGEHLRILSVGDPTAANKSNTVIGTLNAPITAATATVAMTVTWTDHADVDVTDVITVTNHCKETANSGANVVASCAGDLSKNIITNVECP